MKRRGKLKRVSYHFDVKDGGTVCLIARTIGEAKRTFLETGWHKMSDVIKIRRISKRLAKRWGSG